MHGRELIVAAVLAMAALALVVYRPLLERPSLLSQEGVISDHERESDRPRHPVLIFTSDPWPGYAGTVGEGMDGYVVDVLRQIYAPSGYEVRYVNKPRTRCIAETRSGQLTGLAGGDVHEAPDLVYPRGTIGRTRPTSGSVRDTSVSHVGGSVT